MKNCKFEHISLPTVCNTNYACVYRMGRCNFKISPGAYIFDRENYRSLDSTIVAINRNAVP